MEYDEVKYKARKAGKRGRQIHLYVWLCVCMYTCFGSAFGRGAKIDIVFILMAL